MSLVDLRVVKIPQRVFYLCALRVGKLDVDHPFAKFDMSEDSIANKMPLRAHSRKVTAKGIFTDAIVVRGKDWPYGNKYGKKNCEGVVLAVNSFHRGSVEVSFPGSVETKSCKLALFGSVDLKFVNSSSNGTYYPDHLPFLKYKNISGDDFDHFVLSHADDNQNARDNAHLDFVSMLYKDKMGKILANPRSIPDEDFHDHHEKAIEFCLEADFDCS
ncbi:unnamed protein product [Allacma fusca]|uniref:Uncharacterized protein n=1 Tax=Allacma fusca TaxID=39272 RepID=A0A8J2P485_9HEXA|nr:unnamed protein product [Allacma fusca]